MRKLSYALDGTFEIVRRRHFTDVYEEEIESFNISEIRSRLGVVNICILHIDNYAIATQIVGLVKKPNLELFGIHTQDIFVCHSDQVPNPSGMYRVIDGQDHIDELNSKELFDTVTSSIEGEFIGILRSSNLPIIISRSIVNNEVRFQFHMNSRTPNY